MTEDRALDVSIGAALRQARLARAFTQDDLAQALHLDRSAIARYEAGNRSLSASILVRAARALACSVEQLLPVSGGAAPPADAAVLPPEVQQIAQLLASRPDLMPTVLDLLETLLQHEVTEETSG